MATKKKPARRLAVKKQNRKLLLAAAGALVVAVLVFGLVMRAHSASKPLPTGGPLSRQVISYQESLVRSHMPAPTLAALQYAYVSSAYEDALRGGQADALAAASAMLQMLYPDQSTAIIARMHHMALQNEVPSKIASPPAAKIIAGYKQRYARDGHDLAWDGIIPKGPGKWRQVTSTGPLTPRAGDWERWNVSQPISVPPPPVYGSAEDLKQIAIVKQVVASRNGEDVNLINFWAGRPGTETPSGIWQNLFFSTVKHDLSDNALTADQQYARTQKILSQTLSDAFIECWKIKYEYWTARPSMRIAGLSTAMNDPSFPSYVSGHSTISKAAADVLSVTVPKHAAYWEQMADQARETRLKAGIHFDVDNAVGFQVGSNVAQQTVNQLHLKTELP